MLGHQNPRQRRDAMGAVKTKPFGWPTASLDSPHRINSRIALSVSLGLTAGEVPVKR